jgi:hypothetical protein
VDVVDVTGEKSSTATTTTTTTTATATRASERFTRDVT